MKVGEIWIVDVSRGRQMFFVHNIVDGACMSGFNEYDDLIYDKSKGWYVGRKATHEETILFYDLIEEKGYKFNRNTGVSRH